MHEPVAGREDADLHSPRARMKATYDDVLNAPENKVAEILDGELFLSPRPAFEHATCASNLGVLLGGAYGQGLGGRGGWWLLDEPELHFGEQVVVPDIAGWRVERMPRVPRVPFVTLSPDWVCEVLSPSTGRIDRTRKLRIYREAGVRQAWLLDPLQRTLEVFRSEGRDWTIVAIQSGDAPVRAEPFEAYELKLGVLWVDGDEGSQDAR